MPWWYRRQVVRDGRRDVVLLRERNTEGNVVSTGPYDSPDHALQYNIAPEHDPPRPWGSMDFFNVELVEADTRPAPSFEELRTALATGPEAVRGLYQRYESPADDNEDAPNTVTEEADPAKSAATTAHCGEHAEYDAGCASCFLAVLAEMRASSAEIDPQPKPTLGERDDR
jgi:hypothetical protein